MSNPSICLIQSSTGRERSRSSQGGRRPGPGGAEGSKEIAEGRESRDVSAHTPEVRGWGEEVEGQSEEDGRGRQESQQDRSVTCGSCDLKCKSTQQLGKHVVEQDREGRTCLQKLGYATVEELKIGIKNLRKRARVRKL